MASQELLLMLVLDVLYDEETSDVIDDGVFVLRVVVNSLLVFSVITDRVF